MDYSLIGQMMDEEGEEEAEHLVNGFDLAVNYYLEIVEAEKLAMAVSAGVQFVRVEAAFEEMAVANDLAHSHVS